MAKRVNENITHIEFHISETLNDIFADDAMMVF